MTTRDQETDLPTSSAPLASAMADLRIIDPADKPLDASTTKDAEEEKEEVESLQDAALAVPDSDALSASTLRTTSSDAAVDDQALVEQQSSNDTRHQLDWSHMLGLSGQSLNAATTATSFGFAAARTTTAFSLNIAKRVTQSLIALPAMAIDGAVTGSVPNSGDNTPTIASAAHAAVGGIFDVISTLALGGLDVGSAVTGASLGAAASGVEGIRRALGSEVLRSLGAFSRLVKREWHSASDTLPPGGIPGYSVIGITQALTAWVCIQMVTREYYEARMLRHLEPIDLEEFHKTVERERKEEEQMMKKESEGSKEAKVQHKIEDAHREDTPGASSKTVDRKQKKQVRILEEQTLPDGEGDLIGAEIGKKEEPNASESIAEAASISAIPLPTHPVPHPLTNQEAIQGLKRYSKLVLGVYGGVALAWLGSLPPDLMQAAGGSVVDGQAPTVKKPSASTSLQDQSLLGHSGRRSNALDDESDFLQAAASLDLDDAELVEDDMEGDGVLVEASGSSTPSGMPGAFDHGKSKAEEMTKTKNMASVPPSQVLFSVDGSTTQGDDEIASLDPTSIEAPPPPPKAIQKPAAASYSYIDILSGQADADLFHRVAGLEDGAALEGNYDETTSSQAGSAQDRMGRMQQQQIQHRVARPSQPRYYVVTDHGNKKIILVLRGSLSLGDIAIDLTCESANFEINTTSESNNEQSIDTLFVDDEEGPEPAQDFSPEAIKEREAKILSEVKEKQDNQQSRPHKRGEYIVHEGMYETAKEIGEPGRPVHRAVRKALLKNPGYNLDITGHSLGAGVASLLAIMWADPETCLTVQKSGLPSGRRTHAFCFAVPCVMGNQLGKKAEKLVTSYCYSYDLVCRLSLGAILDIRNACAWLAYENNQQNVSSNASSTGTTNTTSTTTPAGLVHPIRLTNIMQRAFQHQSGRMDSIEREKNELEADFLALRKTLEANMRHVELYPPGVVLYSLSKEDLLPSLVRGETSNLSSKGQYLYRLNDDANRDEVFGQIIFSRGMLSRHMPSDYDISISGI